MIGKVLSGAGEGTITNPFVVQDEADMEPYLTETYEGCFVKYAGASTRRRLNSPSNVNKVFPIQALCLGQTKLPSFVPSFRFGDFVIFVDENLPDGTKKRSYLTDFTIEQKSGSTMFDADIYLGNAAPQPHGVPRVIGFGLVSQYQSNISVGQIERVLCANAGKDGGGSEPFYAAYPFWPLKGFTEGLESFNAEGRCIAWGWDEDVTCTINSYDNYDYGVYIEPYLQNQIYEIKKRVKNEGVVDSYYFRPYLSIGSVPQTAGAGYVTPQKTFYDMTGVLQTGNGTLGSPFLVDKISTLSTWKAIGAYFKWVGQSTTLNGRRLTYGSVYEIQDDGDSNTYILMPTLSNPGTAADLAQGKQLIDGDGKVVEGTLTDDIDYTQDVMFWDYDGKLIYACTLDEAKAMTKLPDVPDHSDKGLVFLKWNYTLDDIKNISHGADIGALYDTADEKTHLFFDIVSDLTKDVTLYIIKSYNSQDGTLRIDWGDGTAEEIYEWDKNTTPSSANFPKHTYTMTGQYEVKIENISAYTRQYIYLGSISYSISDARNLFGLALRYGSTNTISTILTKAYVGKRMALSCGACVNLTEISLRYGSVAPCGLQNTQVKHVNVAGDIELYAFRYSAIQTFSCSSNSIEPGAFQNCYNIKRIACKANTQTYSDAISLDLPSLRVCIWPRYSSYRVQLNIKACKKVVLDYVTQWDNSSTSTSLYLLAATKLYMKKFYPYGNNTKVAAGIISAPMLEQLIMDNVTPTPLTAAFTKIPNTCKYYVPDDAVDTYKSTEGWSEMADRIYPMSALTN